MAFQQIDNEPKPILNEVGDEGKHLRSKIDFFVQDNRMQTFYSKYTRKFYGEGFRITELSISALKQLLYDLQRNLKINGY